MPYLTTRDGVPYEMVAEYRESFRQENGTEVTALCLVDWNLRHNFIRAMLADVTIAASPFYASALRRKLPQVHPEVPLCYAVEAEVVDGVGIFVPGVTPQTIAFKERNVNAVGGVIEGFAHVKVTFRTLSYGAVVTDDRLDSPAEGPLLGLELSRFVTRTMVPTAEAIPVGGSWLHYASDTAAERQVIPESLAKTLGVAEVRYTWHMVPYIPYWCFVSKAPGLKIIIGRVNDRTFDRTSGNRLVRDGFPFHTLLYQSADIGEPYYTPSGVRVWDIKMIFSYRPTGWNKFFRRSANDFVQASLLGLPRPPEAPDGTLAYNVTDFLNIFTGDADN